MAGDKIRLLGLMRPAMAILPEVAQPEKKVIFLRENNMMHLNISSSLYNLNLLH